jgi:hypothetical protein
MIYEAMFKVGVALDKRPDTGEVSAKGKDAIDNVFQRPV